MGLDASERQFWRSKRPKSLRFLYSISTQIGDTINNRATTRRKGSGTGLRNLEPD